VQFDGRNTLLEQQVIVPAWKHFTADHAEIAEKDRQSSFSAFSAISAVKLPFQLASS
jgi:hypothetical protein